MQQGSTFKCQYQKADPDELGCLTAVNSLVLDCLYLGKSYIALKLAKRSKSIAAKKVLVWLEQNWKKELLGYKART